MSRLLLLGASGFIGRHLALALREAGHALHTPTSQDADFRRLLRPANWMPHLQGVDAVINAVGALREQRRSPLEPLHHQAPAALFRACASSGVRRVIHLSALGIQTSQTRYARSKLAGDAVLQSLLSTGQLEGCIVRPSLVFGPQGQSSRLCMALARLPVLAWPAEVWQASLQPVAVADLAAACCALLADGGPQELAAVGPMPLTLPALVSSLRRQLGHKPALQRCLPAAWSPWLARVGDLCDGQAFGRESLELLRLARPADVSPLERLLGRPALSPHRFVEQAWSR